MGDGVVFDFDEEDHPEVLGPPRLDWIRSRMHNVLHGSDAILRASVPWDDVPWFDQAGLYFLIWQERICYVGQGRQIGLRLQAHWKEGRPIARVAVILGIPKWAKDEFEHAYARAWDLPWNVERTRSGQLYALPDLLKGVEKLDRSAVMPHFTATLTPPVRAYKGWELHIIGFMQAHPDLFPDLQNF